MQRAALGAAIVITALVLLPRASAAQKPEKQATAEQDGEQVRLVYEDSAPADCPTQAEFESEVTKLTSKAHFTRQPGARRVRIELDRRGSDVLGRLITGDGKDQSSREVRGKDCREVSSALAIAVALTIDPDALGVAPPDPPEDPPPAAEPPKKQEPPRSPPQPVPAQPAPPPPPPRSNLLWGLGVGLTLESAWAPQMRPGPHAYAVLGVGERLRVSLGVARFFTREVDSVSFGAWFGQGSISWNLAVLGVLRPFVVLGYEAGVIDASGSGLATSISAQRPWQAASGGLGLRFESDDVFLQLGGSLLVPISRQRYLVSDPQGEVRVLYEGSRFGLKQETSLGVFL
jgi:hypothetical protein